MSANLKKYRRAFNISQVLLDALKIDCFPIDIFAIAKRCKVPILITSLSDYREWNHSKFFVRDAKCIYNPDRNCYLIIYNDQYSEERIRFSLAHELGHIVLGHLLDQRTEIERGGVSDTLYFFMEGEANTFAGNFLAPPILIHELTNSSSLQATKIANFFRISAMAVKDYRIPDYRHWLKMSPTLHEKALLERFKANIPKEKCKRCGGELNREGFFCAICGCQRSYKNKSGAETMKYTGIKVDRDSKALLCPKCGNEELSYGDRCIICGSIIVNKCTNCSYDDHCEELLPGNARFCYKCGTQSTFFEQGFLVPWSTENEEDEYNQLPF